MKKSVITSENSAGHKGWYITLTIANLLILLLVYFFNAIGSETIPGVFLHNISNQSAKYYLEITPASWTFSIWGFIFTWQGLWVVYSLVLLCRRSADGSPAYLSPLIVSPATVVLYMLANACTIAWLFLFDRDIIEAAFVALLGIPVSLIISLALNYRTLDVAAPSLAQQRRTADIWLVRIFIHNGLAIYATWTSIATLLNMAMVIRYRSDPVIGDQTAGTVALAVLSVEILVFFTADLFFLDRYSRYTITPYIVVVVALIGSIVKNWEAGAVNSIFTAVLLAVGAAGLVIKVIMCVYRHVRWAPYPSLTEPTLGECKGGQLA
ncbi:uncharacterized protein LOC143276658 [Babylonia areolata]|uniref:uncharacterized protein LOC143276658 n=1 Tax=Babylonia areolata TaxID=304850 RepID=UPI003FD40AF6